jgi:hypothetical protein
MLTDDGVAFFEPSSSYELTDSVARVKTFFATGCQSIGESCLLGRHWFDTVAT